MKTKRLKPRPNKNSKSKLKYNILLVILLIIAVIIGGWLAHHFYQINNNNNFYEDLTKDDISDIKKKYKHMNGWITIKDTEIDYPTMKPPKDDDDFYLDHDPDGNYSPAGSIFTDPYSSMELSSNIIIYGHHMPDGSMFGNLGKYEKQKYANKHKTATFRKWYKDGSTTVGDYQVFASLKCDATEEHNYLNYADIRDETKFNDYIKYLKKNTLISSNIKPEFGDELITLSTCSYHIWRWGRMDRNGRFVVVFVKENKSAKERT